MTLRGRLVVAPATLALALALAACSTPATAPAAPGGAAAATPAAVPAPQTTAAPSVSDSLSALPMLVAQHAPTIDREAAVYLDAATILNQARDKAFAGWEASERTLADAKRLAEAYATADRAFIRTVQQIGWQGDTASIAKRLLDSESEMQAAARAAAGAGTWAEYHSSMAGMTEAAALAVASSNQLRLVLEAPACSNVLGLPAVPPQ